MDLTDDQPGLGVCVIFAGVVAETDIALHFHRLFILRKRAHIERPPGQAAREICNLKRYLAADLRTNEPAAKLPQPRWKHQLLYINLVRLLQWLQTE
ncbi:hypothetical protein ES707_09097 [subsurface metagenome]